MLNNNHKGAGRKPGSKNKKPVGVRFTPTVRRETKAWIDKQTESQGKVIDKLVAAKIARQQVE